MLLFRCGILSKYEEMAKSLIEAINSKKEIEAFIKDVDLNFS